MQASSSATGERVVLLFSGGRDSTLAAWMLHRGGSQLELVSYDSGLGFGAELRELRVQELRERLPPESFVYRRASAAGIIRHICFADLVEDVRRDGMQMLLLGCAVALFTLGVSYCIDRHISAIATGAVGYQQHFGDQMPEVLVRFEDYANKRGVRTLFPVREINTEREVRERLMAAGLSPKSLEASTVLSDLGEPDSQSAVAYVDRKLAVADEYLSYHYPT